MALDVLIHLEPKGPVVQGDVVEVSVDIIDMDTLLGADPADVRVITQAPDGTTTTLSYQSAQITKLAVGSYRTTVSTALQAGDYQIEAQATGPEARHVRRWVHVDAALASAGRIVVDGGSPSSPLTASLDGGNP